MTLSFISKRLVQMVVVMWLVATLVFVVFRLLPGDPAALLAGADGSAPQEVLAQLREEMGLNEPILVQYRGWLSDTIRGDLGVAVGSGGIPVTTLLRDPTLRTLELAALAMALGVAIALPLGILAAVRVGSWVDQFARAFAVTAFSLPSFVLALLLLEVFARRLSWLPPGGYVDPAVDLRGHIATLVLPVVAVGLIMAGILVRFVYSSMLEVMGSDYIRTARSKGLSELIVTARHGFRNAAIPVLTIAGLQFGLLVGGMVIVEMVFAWPGLGWLMVQSILKRDYQVVQGAVLISAAIFVVVNTLVDIGYSVLDPRIRHSS